MSILGARYYDGKSSQPHTVSIYIESPTQLHILGDTVDVRCVLADVRVSDRVGNARRQLYFADGAQCETEDNDAVDALFCQQRSVARNQHLHYWESRLHYVVAACVLTLVVTWASVTYGIPALAKQIAFRFPVTTDQLIGKEALAELDQHFLQASRLPAVRQAQLNRLFADLQRDIPAATSYQLVLRDSDSIGANALALPSGMIVMTDPLVKLAKNDDELLGVLAHEIGHLQQRHAMRQILQNSATALVVMTLTGDIGSTTSLAAGLPTLLVQSKYSRDFEREADDFAFSYLKKQHRSPEALTGILLRMEKRTDESNWMRDIFSTHPSTQERTKRAQ
jgi:Zn-dependent protease with chaperone function